MMPLVTGPKISAWAASGAGLKIEQVMAVQSEDGVITSVYFIGNPDKLTSVGHGSGARRARGGVTRRAVVAGPWWPTGRHEPGSPRHHYGTYLLCISSS
jgi:hypothetical protein